MWHTGRDRVEKMRRWREGMVVVLFCFSWNTIGMRFAHFRISIAESTDYEIGRPMPHWLPIVIEVE